MSELNPCPFCGGEAEIMSHPVYTYLKPYDPETADKKYYAQCKECATQCGVLEYDTPEEAKAAWEHRAEPDNEPLTLDELREMSEQNEFCGAHIWIKDLESGWVTVDITDETAKDGIIGVWCADANDVYREKDYGETWLAYRSEPKEAQDER